jgi:hypothetical protein
MEGKSTIARQRLVIRKAQDEKRKDDAETQSHQSCAEKNEEERKKEREAMEVGRKTEGGSGLCPRSWMYV